MRLTILRWTLRLLGIAVCVNSLLWFIREPGWESRNSLIEALFGIAGLAFSFVLPNQTTPPPSAEPRNPEHDRRNRHSMLQLVRSTWIKGVLEQSLQNAVLVELQLEKRADLVAAPWDIQLLSPDKPPQALALGTTILDVFSQGNHPLLILGEPGSGKTTMLLRLANDTIASAEKDPTKPIPVVFSLSSWRAKQSIADWLVAEFLDKYLIPENVSRDWIDHNQLLLLLDALDEVPPEDREACVTSINAFRRQHLVPIVVCSRLREYEAMERRLEIKSAVSIHPLTSQQVVTYLKRAGPELAALREVIDKDPVLADLSQTPLWLSVMTLAYAGRSVRDIRATTSLQTRRNHILGNYVERMLKRRPLAYQSRYSSRQTLNWLSWLAQNMTRHGQSLFLLDSLQPSCLPNPAQRRLLTRGMALILPLVWAAVGTLLGALLCGLGNASVFGPFTLFGDILVIATSGLIFGAWSFVSAYRVIHHRIRVLEAIRPVTLRWHWHWPRWPLPAALTEMPLITLIGWLLISLLCGLGAGLVGGLIVGIIYGQLTALLLLLLTSLVYSPFLGLQWLVESEISTSTSPNEGIRRSLRCAVIGSLFYGLLMWSLMASIGALYGGLYAGLRGAVYFGLVIGLFGLLNGAPFGLVSGGWAFVRHVLLRILLWHNDFAPVRYVEFLDSATERTFLRKVGGGYVFVHQALTEYFASLQPQDSRQPTP